MDVKLVGVGCVTAIGSLPCFNIDDLELDHHVDVTLDRAFGYPALLRYTTNSGPGIPTVIGVVCDS